MELVLIIVISLLATKHRKGFSQIQFQGARAVYFFSDHDQMEVHIDGVKTGLTGPGMLYFSAKLSRFQVDYKMNGLIFFSQDVCLSSDKTIVMGQITPVINLLA